MAKLEKVIYTARAHTTGGRDGGASRTDDGRLDVKLSIPGKPGTGTNPEQLFAVGWSACFLSAIKIAASKARIALPDDVSIDVEVDLTEHLHILPVFGPAALAASPRIGHIHVTVDDSPWHWADASGNPIIVKGLPAGRTRS